MGAAIGIALQGIMDGFRLLGGLAAAIFSGDLSGALDAGIGLFRNFGETALGVFPALGEGILGGLSSLWAVSYTHLSWFPAHRAGPDVDPCGQRPGQAA